MDRRAQPRETWFLRGFSGWLIAGLCLISSWAWAESPGPWIQQNKLHIQQTQGAWQSSQNSLQQARQRQIDLAAKIDQHRRNNGAKAELSRLLAQSVEAERTLYAAFDRVDEGQKRWRTVVDAALSETDQRIRGLVPRLREGTTADRKQAAFSIKELRAFRAELVQMKATWAMQGQAQGAWDPQVLKVERFDGPRELDDKADFIEDTAEKIRKKRKALLALLEQSKRDRELSVATRDFQVELSLFDEEARSGRVLRSASSLSSSSRSNGNGGGTNAAAQEDTVESAAAAPQSGGQAENGKDFAVSPQISQPTQDFRNQFGRMGDSVPSSNPNPTIPQVEVRHPSQTPSPNVSVAPPSTPKQLDPTALLRLRIESLAAAGGSPRELQSLLKRLADLETYLEVASQRMRKKADSLRQQENKP